MAELKGNLRVGAGESSVNGRLLAICGGQDPIAEATDFLAGLKLMDGDSVIITGQAGVVGAQPVFCVSNAQSADALDADTVEVTAAEVTATRTIEKVTVAARKPVPKATRSMAKKQAPKETAKKKSRTSLASRRAATSKKSSAALSRKRGRKAAEKGSTKSVTKLARKKTAKTTSKNKKR